MENFTLEELFSLAEHTRKPAISIFLPTHRAGRDTQQDPIRYKNLLRAAERQLLDEGMGPRQVSALLAPAQALQEDSVFWQHQYDGLAVFVSPDDFHHFRLPIRVEEQLIIARSYIVKPILPLFTNNGHYYILAISQDEIRLFEGTQFSVGQIDLPEQAPTSLDEALRFDDPEKQLQVRSATTSAGMFHGHGPGDEQHKIRLERYLNLVDAGLREVFRGQQTPLVLAGVDYLLPIYRRVSEYPHIIAGEITGSPQAMRPEELQERAWPLVAPHFRQELDAVIARYHELAGAGRATDSLEAIVAAAYYGRVDSLIIASDRPLWGCFNFETGHVEHYQDGQSAEDDLALLDFAALKTMRNGGTVYALPRKEMPASVPAMAILRY